MSRIRNGHELVVECDDCFPVDSTPAAVIIPDVRNMHHTQLDAAVESFGFKIVKSDQEATVKTYCPECAEERGL